MNSGAGPSGRARPARVRHPGDGEPPARLRQALDSLAARPIEVTDKGFGALAARGTVTVASLAAARPPLFGGDFMPPLLVLRDSALRHNALAMADWCARAGVLLAPHGKTTMAPQLFARQIAAGAWGMTVATVGQAQVCRAFGIGRVLIANELADPAGIGWLAGQLADPGWECYAYVDSAAGVELLGAALRAGGAPRPLPVLVELGFPGGRTGCRTVAEALAVAAAVAGEDALALAGAAGYEGGLGAGGSRAGLDAVAAWCARLRELAGRLPGEPPDGRRAWIVSAGGSAYPDVVARELTAGGDHAAEVVLRSGCYLTHDHGEYARTGPDARGAGPGLVPAIEVWAPVLSRPEPGLALACAGRRDVPFDKGLPVPLRLRRADGAVVPADGIAVTGLDDQHAYLSVPAGAGAGPGDLICLGISHPCTAFDKWRLIPVVDDEYRVIDAVRTFF